VPRSDNDIAFAVAGATIAVHAVNALLQQRPGDPGIRIGACVFTLVFAAGVTVAFLRTGRPSRSLLAFVIGSAAAHPKVPLTTIR
jgi:CHASE2 domain-containing sensor protein